MASADAGGQAIVPLLTLGFNSSNWALVVQVNTFVLAAIVIVGSGSLWLGRRYLNRKFNELDLDETVLGVGSASFKLRPNLTDRQVAYQIWVELSTRKIGLEIDLDDDVIVEIYYSWHSFFGVTRELIKTIPINKASSASTQKITSLSIDVLNKGLRPHLTKWQARFRSWYDHMKQNSENEGIDPQDLQKRFSEFAALKSDLLEVNKKLMAYRRAMKLVAYGKVDAAEDALVTAKMVVNDV